MRRTKAQGAVEFMILMGALLIFSSIFLLIINLKVSEKMQEKEELELKQVILAAKEEIDIAQKASEGYQRKFELPVSITGKNYSLNLTSNSIYGSTDRSASSYPIGNITGYLKHGINTIKKQNGSVFIN